MWLCRGCIAVQLYGTFGRCDVRGGRRMLTQTRGVDTRRRLVFLQTNDKSPVGHAPKGAELNDEHKTDRQMSTLKSQVVKSQNFKWAIEYSFLRIKWVLSAFSTFFISLQMCLGNTLFSHISQSCQRQMQVIFSVVSCETVVRYFGVGRV